MNHSHYGASRDISVNHGGGFLVGLITVGPTPRKSSVGRRSYIRQAKLVTLESISRQPSSLRAAGDFVKPHQLSYYYLELRISGSDQLCQASIWGRTLSIGGSRRTDLSRVTK